MADVAYRSCYNPKTKKYFGFPDNYVPDPVNWRRDYWTEAGFSRGPTTWENVRRAAPRLRAQNHPIGIGMSNEIDSNMALMAMMMCFGSFIQNRDHRVTLNTPKRPSRYSTSHGISSGTECRTRSSRGPRRRTTRRS